MLYPPRIPTDSFRYFQEYSPQFTFGAVCNFSKKDNRKCMGDEALSCSYLHSSLDESKKRIAAVLYVTSKPSQDLANSRKARRVGFRSVVWVHRGWSNFLTKPHSSWFLQNRRPDPWKREDGNRPATISCFERGRFWNFDPGRPWNVDPGQPWDFDLGRSTAQKSLVWSLMSSLYDISS